MAPLSHISLWIACLCGLVLAHGSLKAIEVGGKQYMAWQINSDPYAKPPPVRFARRVLNEGPVKDFTGKGITYAGDIDLCWETDH
jgi:cellulase